MTAADERILHERDGAARSEGVPMGLVWLKWDQQVSRSGLDEALRTAARLYKGLEDPDGEAPSMVICCPRSEEALVPEVKSVRALTPNSVVLVLAPSPNLRLARAVLEAGASGLLHAGMRPEQILRAVRVALEGETVLPRGLLAEWVAEQRPPNLEVLLSARQRKILELVAEGLTNVEIAGRLFLSESTVKQHLRKAYKALGIRNRREAAALSRRYMKLHGA